MKKQTNTMDLILALIAVFLLVYTAVVLVMFWFKGYEPSTLTSCIFLACTGECGFMGWIKTAKIKKDTGDKNDTH